MAHNLLWSNDGVVLTWSGDVYPDELRQCAMSISSHANFNHCRWGLHDFTDCGTLFFEDAHMLEVAVYLSAASKHNDRLRFAFVPRRSDVIEMLASLDRAGMPSYTHQVFDRRAEAMQWLNTPQR